MAPQCGSVFRGCDLRLFGATGSNGEDDPKPGALEFLRCDADSMIVLG